MQKEWAFWSPQCRSPSFRRWWFCTACSNASSKPIRFWRLTPMDHEWALSSTGTSHAATLDNWILDIELNSCVRVAPRETCITVREARKEPRIKEQLKSKLAQLDFATFHPFLWTARRRPVHGITAVRWVHCGRVVATASRKTEVPVFSRKIVNVEDRKAFRIQLKIAFKSNSPRAKAKVSFTEVWNCAKTVLEKNAKTVCRMASALQTALKPL